VRDLHILPNPPDDAVVCVIKGYFDNSGDAEDPQHRVVTVGGFIATERQWADFEIRWKANLLKYSLPYLHMKEFSHFIKPFYIFKDNKDDRIDFLQGCTSALRDSGIKHAVCHAVRIRDVNRFKRKIDCFSFCLYAIYIDIRDMFAIGTNVELIIDRLPKVTKNIYQEEEYSRTDTFNNYPSFNVSTRPLSESLSMREVLPIQAADLLV
jgi:hypothetical protein